MFFFEPIFPRDKHQPQFDLLVEQALYLRGVFLADPEYRMAKDFDRKLIDPYGAGTKAFWRGVLETTGSIHLKRTGGRDYSYPSITLRGSYAFLRVFLDLLEEQLGTPVPGPAVMNWKFDDDGKLDFQAMGKVVSMTGQKAQDVVRLLYSGETVGKGSARQTADAIFQWTSRSVR